MSALSDDEMRALRRYERAHPDREVIAVGWAKSGRPVFDWRDRTTGIEYHAQIDREGRVTRYIPIYPRGFFLRGEPTE